MALTYGQLQTKKLFDPAYRGKPPRGYRWDAEGKLEKKPLRIRLPCGMSMSQYESGWQCIDEELIAPPPRNVPAQQGYTTITKTRKQKSLSTGEMNYWMLTLPVLVLAVVLIGGRK